MSHRASRAFLLFGLVLSLASQALPQGTGPAIEVALPPLVRGPVHGRVFVFVTRDPQGEPRLARGSTLFARDVPGDAMVFSVVLDGATPGSMGDPLAALAPGDYRVEALLNVYTEFHRSDGHTIWAHMDQWDGQDFARSPGNWLSEPRPWRMGPGGAEKIKLELVKQIPPIVVPPDTPWVKRVKIQSALLTRFWGHPIFLGATLLLPKGYADRPETSYPAIYLQGHFDLSAPFGFTTTPDPPGTKSWARQREEWRAQHLNRPEPPPGTPGDGALKEVESGYEFAQAWQAEGFPRMIAVTFQHPTPYYDDSYAVNSANCGPYGDAIMTELIPYVETHFRIRRTPAARLLAGGSTGGWTALALQIHHPDFFGGAWGFSPDPLDFRRYYFGRDIYQEDNAFVERPERYLRGGGNLARRFSQVMKVLDREDGIFQWWIYTPVGDDGYPRPVWDLTSGRIDHAVADYMRRHDYDLRDYLARNWKRIGPLLVGKLHVVCGDEDTLYENLSVYLFEDFLENTRDPYYGGSFTYGRPMKGHGWQPTTNAELVRQMAAYVAQRLPAGPDGNRSSE